MTDSGSRTDRVGRGGTKWDKGNLSRVVPGGTGTGICIDTCPTPGTVDGTSKYKTAESVPPLPVVKPTFALTLVALPNWGNAPATIRLKRFLKAALRSYGLRCTEAREITPALPDAARGSHPAPFVDPE